MPSIPPATFSRFTSMAAVVAVLTLTIGCASDAKRMIEEGYPPAFVSGYVDGCDTGRHAAGRDGSYKKDVRRFMSDTLYADGWRDGFAVCEARSSASNEELQFRLRLPTTASPPTNK